MKHLKTLAVIIAGLCCCSTVKATETYYDFSTGGVHYKITSDTTVEVYYSGYNTDDEWIPPYRGNVVIPETVTNNGNTYTVTTINGEAFHYCPDLVSVVIPETVTQIGSFYMCENLVSVNIPSGVTLIPNSAFSGCESLTSITIPSNVTSIGNYAFSYCESLTSITIPSNVTSIGDYAFNYCQSLQSIVIPDGITSIGSYTFCGCSGLTSVSIPSSVTSIKNNAFYGCSSLSSITVNSATSATLSTSAFYNVPKSCVLTYPKGCYESYASWADYITVPLTDFSVDGIFYNVLSEEDLTVEVTFQGEKYNSYTDEYTGDVVIPETVTYADKTFTVTAIGEFAFGSCKNVTSIQLPSTIKEIKEYGVNACTKLTSINLPEGLTTIGPLSIRMCSSLTSLEIPSSVTSIGESAFHDNDELVSITFKGAVSSIGSGVFSYCEKLTEIHVEDMADWCQMGFTSETSNPLSINLIHNESGSKIIGSQGALYLNGEKVTHLVIPDNVEKINDYAFNYCEEITSIDFGKGLKEIGNYAFAKCTGLTSLTIPANVTSIGNYVFEGDYSNMSTLTIEDATEPLELGYMGDGLVEGSGLFATCRLRESIYIGRDLVYDNTHFGGYSPFNLANGNYVTSVTFGKYVTEVGKNLFGGDNTVFFNADIYFHSNPILGDGALETDATTHLSLSDTEATDFDANNANTYADVTYERELPADKYGTIMLPFVPDAESLNNFIFYELTSADDDALMFDEASAPQANTPYLYTLREGKEATQITGGQTTIAADINNPETVNNLQMTGSFTNETIVTEDDANNYYYAYTTTDNMLHKVTKKLTVKPYRAYFTAPALVTSGARSLSVYLRGADGIKKISADKIEDFDSMLYDLSGRPVTNPVKGNIYIKKGKKEIY